MFDQITKPITDAIGALTGAVQGVTGFFTISPFWIEWLPMGIGIIALCAVVTWFFPPVRGFAGAVVLSTIAFLVGFRKGEGGSTARHKKEIDRLKAQKQQPQQRQAQQRDNWWSW